MKYSSASDAYSDLLPLRWPSGVTSWLVESQLSPITKSRLTQRPLTSLKHVHLFRRIAAREAASPNDQVACHMLSGIDAETFSRHCLVSPQFFIQSLCFSKLRPFQQIDGTVLKHEIKSCKKCVQHHKKHSRSSCSVTLQILYLSVLQMCRYN